MESPSTTIAASDAAAEDTLRKTLLLQVGPASVRTNVLTVERTVRVYWNPDYAGMRTMIWTYNERDIADLDDLGVDLRTQIQDQGLSDQVMVISQ